MQSVAESCRLEVPKYDYAIVLARSTRTPGNIFVNNQSNRVDRCQRRDNNNRKNLRKYLRTSVEIYQFTDPPSISRLIICVRFGVTSLMYSRHVVIYVKHNLLDRIVLYCSVRLLFSITFSKSIRIGIRLLICRELLVFLRSIILLIHWSVSAISLP